MNNKVDEIWVRDQQEQELQICGAFEMDWSKELPKNVLTRPTLKT